MYFRMSKNKIVFAYIASFFIILRGFAFIVSIVVKCRKIEATR